MFVLICCRVGRWSVFCGAQGSARPFANHPFAATNPNLVTLAQNVLAAGTMRPTRAAGLPLSRQPPGRILMSGRIHPVLFPCLSPTPCACGWQTASTNFSYLLHSQLPTRHCNNTKTELGYPKPLSCKVRFIWRMFKAIKRHSRARRRSQTIAHHCENSCTNRTIFFDTNA